MWIRRSVVQAHPTVPSADSANQPLYTFIKDTKPGEVMGDGANDVWHVAKPD